MLGVVAGRMKEADWLFTRPRADLILGVVAGRVKGTDWLFSFKPSDDVKRMARYISEMHESNVWFRSVAG